MTYKNYRQKIFTAGVLALSVLMRAHAGPYGFDLHNVLSPKAAGMAGTTIAGENGGAVEATFGNPANLADFAGGTQFTFGGTVYYPEAEMVRRDVNTGAQLFDVRSNAEAYPVPQIAVTQDISGVVGMPIVLGLGLSATSGIGVHYRREPATFGAGAEFIILGINTGFSYQVSDKLDLGFALTTSYAMLEAGFGGTSGQGHDIGFRGTFGADYHINDATDIGMYLQTEQRHTWQDFILLANSTNIATADFRSLSVEQPANYAIGVSHQINDKLRVAADFIYKDWDRAAFWQKFYKDQKVYSLGVEYQMNAITWRAGYGYADDPTREVNEDMNIEGFSHVCVGAPALAAGGCLPLNAGNLNFLQVLETPVIYKHRLTAGMTYDGFLAPFLSLDLHAAHQFREKRTYELSGVKADVKSWHAGFALNWDF